MEDTQFKKEINSRMLIISLAIGAFISTMNMTNINIALPFIMKDFQTDMATVQWVVTSCMLTWGLIMPTAGYFMNKFGARNLFLVSLSFLVLTSLMCAISNNMSLLIISRLLQGISLGIINTLPMAAVYQTLPPKHHLSAVSTVAMILSLGAAMGPSLSGIVIDLWGWQAIFIVNVPIVLLDIFLIYQFLPQKVIAANQKLDFVGLITSTIGTIGLLIGFTQGDTLGWYSPITITILLCSILFLIFFIYYEIKQTNPMLNFSVFLNKGFVFMFILNAICNTAINAAPLFMSLFLQNVIGYTATGTGLAMIIPSLAMAVMAPVAAKSKQYFSGPTILLFSLIVLTIATWQLSCFTITTTLISFTFWLSLRYASMGLMSPIINNIAMASLPMELTGHASAMMNWSRQLLATIAMSLFSILYSKQLSFLTSTNVEIRMAETQAISLVNEISAVCVLLTIPLILYYKKISNKNND